MIHGKRALLVLIGIALFSTYAMSQTRAELASSYGTLNGYYGSPYGVIYWIKPTLVMHVDFNEKGQAHTLNFSLREVIERETAVQITENLTAKRRKGELHRHITFSGGCTSIESFSYKNVTISYTLVCQPEGGSKVTRMLIRWKD